MNGRASCSWSRRDRIVANTDVSGLLGASVMLGWEQWPLLPPQRLVRFQWRTVISVLASPMMAVISRTHSECGTGSRWSNDILAIRFFPL